MKCKNCGATLSDNAKVCKNCGAFVDDESGYTLLAADDRYLDVYSSAKKKKTHRGITVFLTFVLLVLIGIGAYVYFTQISPNRQPAPNLTFETGAGLINRNERVIYITLPKGSDIEYIHGVSLYDYDITDKENKEDKAPLTTDYEYTKNIDSTFRLIYFDTKPLKLKKKTEYTYYFEMKFVFRGNDTVYTYTQPIKFKSNAKDDVSDIVFDHSMNTDGVPEENSTAVSGDDTSQKTAETTLPPDNTAFISDGYWYTAPVTNGNVRSISAFRFGTDNTYTVTNYEKDGDKEWNVSAEEGTYSLKDGKIILSEQGEFTVDTESQSIYEEQDGKKTQTLTHRNYNSVQNSEDFFGI